MIKTCSTRMLNRSTSSVNSGQKIQNLKIELASFLSKINKKTLGNEQTYLFFVENDASQVLKVQSFSKF